MLPPDTHIFSLYLPEIAGCTAGSTWRITNADLIHRMSRVLRLSVESVVILFNKDIHAHVKITNIAAREITVLVDRVNNNAVLQPEITFLLPVFKREALSHAVYGLVEAGISSIQLVIPDKVKRVWGGKKELERLHRVVIAAAEQAKNFSLPTIKEPIALSEALNSLKTGDARYVGDPAGSTVVTALDQYDRSTKRITLLVGPEGDLTSQEKQVVQDASFEKIRLTPTVLRAEMAAFSMASIFRSVFLFDGQH